MTNSTPNPVPKSLQRAGLKRTTSNLGEGQMLNIPGDTIWLFFEDEIKKAFWPGDGDDGCRK